MARPNAPATRRAPQLALVAALFVASGAAALVVQVVWTRWLVLALGASTFATIAVLAAFMGGLGIGSLVAGWLADRRAARALRFFALAELAVGLWSLLSIPLYGRLLPSLAAALASEGAFSTPLALRVGLAALALLVPTCLMGASLPLLARWAVSAGGLAGRDIGDLYSLNTLGGAAGALLAPLVLIEALGLSGSVALAGAIDIGVGLAALAIAARPASATTAPRGDARKTDARNAPADLPGTEGPSAGALYLAACTGAFLCGFVGLALEVIAHRVIAVLAGSSSYAFAAMLAAFLLGIGAGGFGGARVAERTKHPALWLAIAMGVLAFGVGLTRALFDPEPWGALARAARGTGVLSSSGYVGELIASLVVLLPATLALGFALPFVAAIAGRTPALVARRFGVAYALNTAGAVLGAVIGGIVLVPRLGSAASLTLLVGLAGSGALVVAALGLPRPLALRAAAAVLALTVAGGAAGWSTDPVRRALLARFPEDGVRAFREGPVQTIAVVDETDLEQLRFLRLITNQTSLTGTTVYAERYMRLLGHLPVIFSRAPERGLVICLGTGMTAAAVATHPDVRELVIAEISPEVVEVAPLFREVTGDVLDDPRARIVVEDGRHVLLASHDPWGFVTLEPPPPRDSGVVSLYTTEFYELVRARLAPGGVLAQWIPLHSQSRDEIRMLIRSFVDTMPHVWGVLAVDRELVLLGSDAPLARTADELQARMNGPKAAASLRAIGIEHPADLVATAFLDRKALEAVAGDASAVTDDRPRVEYFARYGRRPGLPQVSDLIAAPLPLASLVTGPADSDFALRFQREREALVRLHRAAWSAQAGKSQEGYAIAKEAYRIAPDDPYVLWTTRLSDAHLALLESTARARRDVRLHRDLAQRAWERRLLDRAERAYVDALAIAPDDPDTLLQYATLIGSELGRQAEAEGLLRRFVMLAPSHPAVPAIKRALASTAR